MKKVNQQGTLIKDISETIRISDLKLKCKKSFLNWFIGFVEGNENVFIVNRRYLRFEINVSLKNQSILYYIKNNLGFGKIRKLRFLGGVILELSVQENILNLLKLVYIFNGNLRCKNKELSFSLFYKKLRTKLKKLDLLHLLPEYISTLAIINLTNSWFAGYIEMRALFNARWHKSKKLKEGKELYLSCILWHLNFDLLQKIKTTLNLNVKIEGKTKWNLPFYKLEIKDIQEKNLIINYLNKFKLKGEKLNRFKYWKYLYKLESIYLQKGEQNFEEIDKFLKKLNFTIEEGELSKV